MRRIAVTVTIASIGGVVAAACAQLEGLDHFEDVECADPCVDASFVDAPALVSVPVPVPDEAAATPTDACTDATCDAPVDACTADTCVVEPPPASCSAIKKTTPGAADGVYTIAPAGSTAPFDAYCDMTTGGGGWTLAMNLDTSDGHVMWWGNALWVDANVYGTVKTPFAGDFKGAAWMSYSAATKLLLVVHQQGAVLGWKSFAKANVGTTLFGAMQGPDNTPIGASVIDTSVAPSLAPGERLVRLSTGLFANHCIENFGTCTSGTTGPGAPDGDRIGSNEGTPSDNNGGGLGNWHDMGFCCVQEGIGGIACNGATFRTVAEAQLDWGVPACGYGVAGGGIFGTDSFVPPSASCTDSSCTTANWSTQSGLAYDYAIYLAE